MTRAAVEGIDAHAGPRVPPLVLLPAAYTSGTLVAATVGGAWWLTVVVAVLGGGALAVHARTASARTTLLLVATVLAAACGHARYASSAARPPPRIASVGGEHEFVGVLRDDPSVTGVTERVDLGLERLDGRAADGGVRLTLRVPREALIAGDRLRVRGTIEPPPAVEAFDYAGYLRSRGVYAVSQYPREWQRIGHDNGGLREPLRVLRRWATSNIERSLPEPAAALCAGVLLGERRTMPPAMTDALRLTGTTHLVVVSGQNVALLLGSAISLLAAVMSKRRAAVVALALLPPYVLLVGADPPVVRAAIMSVGITGAIVTGRRTPGWIYLLDAGAVMLVLDPLLARDVAFQLSMLATAGVMLLAPVLSEAALARLPERAAALATFVELATTATAATLWRDSP